ncbi:MAG: hypothetical protein ACLR08_01805 [Dorea longicatena]
MPESWFATRTVTGNQWQVHNKINTVSRFNMLIAIPCAVGFITLAKPILNLLYFYTG